jgi:hypothetical protein
MSKKELVDSQNELEEVKKKLLDYGFDKLDKINEEKKIVPIKEKIKENKEKIKTIKEVKESFLAKINSIESVPITNTRPFMSSLI